MSSKDTRALDGTRRDRVDDAEHKRLEDAHALAEDDRRSRPRYFDGRFLAARDLTGDQDYFLRRQADLGRATGWGVVHGLEVLAQGGSATKVRIRAGLGLTPAGEPVVLHEEIEVDLLSLRESQMLDAHIGLRKDKTRASKARSGPFVLALRPVEYTANPRAGYPTTVQGTAHVEDHDIVEATAVTLIPWQASVAGGPDVVRRGLAREIFLAQSGRGVAADLLPIAMVYVDGVSVRWLDMHLVRRPIGGDRDDLLGFGVTSRAAAAAFVRQYEEHLEDVMQRAHRPSIAAAEHFDALPPVGPMPFGSLDRTTFTQGFFPPEIDVDLSFVPSDELPLIIEEGLMLPPIDLGADADALQGISVLLLLPIDRALLRQFQATLKTVRRPLVRRILRTPVARTPILALSRLRLPSVQTALELATPVDALTAAWTELVGKATGGFNANSQIWYTRRRNHNFKADVEGSVVQLDVTPEGKVT